MFWAERKQFLVERLRYGDIRIVEYGPVEFSLWIDIGSLPWLEEAVHFFVHHSEVLERRILTKNATTMIVQIIIKNRGKALRIWRTNNNGGQNIMVPWGRDGQGWKRLGETLFWFIQEGNAGKGKGVQGEDTRSGGYGSAQSIPSTTQQSGVKTQIVSQREPVQRGGEGWGMGRCCPKRAPGGGITTSPWRVGPNPILFQDLMDHSMGRDPTYVV
ncbi:hypothetical protein Scep_006873 [Stephania cephalantha]|uniref:Uncharacterized protein n=1 Tax=Stephania cephalantha TaxID=152367 RepID=A0AAP0K8T1_9MAGN